MKNETLFELEGKYPFQTIKLIVKKVAYSNHRGNAYKVSYYGESPPKGNHALIKTFDSEQTVKQFISLSKSLIKFAPSYVLTRKDFIEWYSDRLYDIGISCCKSTDYLWIDTISN